MENVFRISDRFKIAGIDTVYTVKNYVHSNVRIGDILYDLQGNRFKVKSIEMFRQILDETSMEDMPLGIILECMDGVEAVKLYELDDLIRYEWARIPHFYTPFYVYQYATGFSAAIAISSKILAKEEGIVEKYKAFLSGGCSMDPIDLLKLCGVDMEKKEPVEEALKVFEQYLTELEKLV